MQSSVKLVILLMSMSLMSMIDNTRSDDQYVPKGIAVIKSNTVNGLVCFQQSADGSVVTVRINVTGLVPSGNHGFHVHQFGDLSNGCMSTGSHFNTNNYTHGAPTDSMRHVGDLGNIVADNDGKVVMALNDTQIKLSGQNSIIGRAVVFHAMADDLGKGTGDKESESKKTGNAGGRVACAVIGIAKV
ncbi:superoxide dismutase [Cu-Zn]-like [Oppia nitens]|uniref:superoxide dismutase [Cu-Zn]-like n=1 Tax=Oppia nitens TaxID=1686743 RepID=UPI0023DCD8CA|nr:superoxide dismutase [Cu-Zn]-like [Oppia nitens]